MSDFKLLLNSMVSPFVSDLGGVNSCGLEELGLAVSHVTRGSWKLDSKVMGFGLATSKASEVGVLAGVRGPAFD